MAEFSTQTEIKVLSGSVLTSHTGSSPKCIPMFLLWTGSAVSAPESYSHSSREAACRGANRLLWPQQVFLVQVATEFPSVTNQSVF